MIRVTMLMALASCTGLTPKLGEQPGEVVDIPGADAGLADPGTEDPTGTMVDLEVELRAALQSGEIGPLMHKVAWSAGWPFHTADDTWIFVHEGDVAAGLAGGHNGWEFSAMSVGVGFSWIEISISDPRGSPYKFVQGVDGSTGVWVADPWARSYADDEFGEFSHVLPPDDVHFERWPGLEGRGLVRRNVVVRVPSGVGPWPVLYAHDGQNLFDEQAIWGGWRLNTALQGVDDMLVVGVDNTADRMSEYTHTSGAGDDYADLIVLDLMPVISAAYPVSDVTGVMGSSLGGLISLHIGSRHPDAVDFVASLSGTLWWGDSDEQRDLVRDRYLADPPDVALYVDSGGGPGPDGECRDPNADGSVADDPDDEDNYCSNREFVDAMADAGYVWDENLWHWWVADAPHNEMAWAERVDLPLSLFADLSP